MVAVDSKSIPEKQNVSLNLSKDSEDKLNTELFSEIFSSQGINNQTSAQDTHEKIHSKTNTKNSIDETNAKNSIDEKKQNQHNKELSNNLNPSNTSSKYKEKTEELSIKELNSRENEYINEIGYSLNNTFDEEDVPPLIALGALHNTKEIIPGGKENKIIEEVDEDTNQSQNGNILLNPLNPLVNTRIKNKNNQKNIPENLEDKLSNFSNIVSKESVPKFEKNISEQLVKETNNIGNKDFKFIKDNSLTIEKDIMVNEDYTKIKKENMINDKQINFKSLSKDMISGNDTEKFFETKYFKNSNVLAPQSKNNLNNQLSLNSSSLELNTINQSSNTSNGNNGSQTGAQSNPGVSNYQIYSDVKEILDMSDKRWASNLVSKINKSNSSKNSEIELHLSPKNLGKLKIKISVSNKTAFVKISTDSAATSSMILNEENKLSEMLKEVGLELEDFSSENSFNQGFNNEERRKTESRIKADNTNNSNDINDQNNYIKDESLLNIKV